MKTFFIVFIGLCCILSAESFDRERHYEHEHGLDYRRRHGEYRRNHGEDYVFEGPFGSYYDDRYNHRKNNEPDTACPEQKKENQYCLAIPGASRDNNRADRVIGEFSWKLFQNSNTEPNFALSPLSPQIILSYLTWLAKGQTKNELERVSKFKNPKTMENIISELKQTKPDKKTQKIYKELEVATGFFVADNLKLNSAFVSSAAEKVDIKAVDFGDALKSGEVFSSWVKEKTKGLLKVEGNFSPSTRIVLASALYFKAQWQFEFETVEEMDFTLLDGTIKKVPGMRTTEKKFHGGKIEDYASWMSVPYRAEESMIIILPHKSSSVDDVIEKMDESTFVSILSDMKEEETEVQANVTMPKFKLETSTSLIEPFRKLGLNKIFSSDADFGYMTNEAVQISDVKQQTQIEVNEEGTILASVTKVQFVGLSVQRRLERIDFIVDRPFIAAVVHKTQSVPYVICKVTDPKF